MSDKYVAAKIQEALKVTNGDKHDAVKLLTTWAVRDQALLLGFTKTHLKDLISAQIDGVSKTRKKADQDASSFKEAIVFGGDKRAAVAVPPPKSSDRQASVMHQLVEAFKKKK